MNPILVKIKLRSDEQIKIYRYQKIKRIFAINRFTDISKGLKKISNIIIKMKNKRQEPLVLL